MAQIHVQPHASLHLRDPDASPTGRRILKEGLELMTDIGLEAFTFRKLADKAGCTEVTVYNYFANKQRLLQYFFQVYWLWLLANTGERITGEGARQRLSITIRTLCGIWPKGTLAAQLDPDTLRDLVILEGSKSFLHKNVDADNALKLFKPYKDLCAQVATALQACAPDVPQPRSFATMLLEMSHSLDFAMRHLPALTELSNGQDRKQLAAFLDELTHRYLQHEP